MIIGIHNAQVTIPDGAENVARKFYCELLGLPKVKKPASLEGRGGFWLEVGNWQVHIGAENGVDRFSTKAHIAYLVDNLESRREILQSENFEIIEGIPIPGYKRFEFRDPFGNRVEFLEKTR